jgi:pimeloyl-ACP methyl ester carboxylesterase
VQESVWQDLHKIKAKTLVIWGKENRVQTFDNGLFMLSRIPDVQLHVFGQCSHWSQIEKAKGFNQLLAQFFGGAL